MQTKTKPIPDGYEGLTPYLVCHDAAKAIEFYRNLFGAQEITRMTYPNSDRIAHAELKIGNAILMLGDENRQMGVLSPLSLNGPSPVSLMLYTPEVDAVFAKATQLGAKVLMPPMDMFWGDRYCKITDPFGHGWALATHIEDVPPAEMPARAAKAFAEMPGCS